MVPSDFASLDHEVLELLVNLPGRVLPRKQVAYGRGQEEQGNSKLTIVLVALDLSLHKSVVFFTEAGTEFASNTT